MTIEGQPEGRTHWSRQSMAATIEMSPSTVGRIWADYGLKPHLHRPFKISNDKPLVEKREDVVGLYMNPPENAIVFSYDEKSHNPSFGSYPAWPANEGRSYSDFDAGLQKKWHYISICGSQDSNR